MKLKTLDRYILKQVLEIFILGVLIFTSIIFASDTFTRVIKQISNFGIPFHIAFMTVLLNLPAIIVMSIPMSILLATVMTINKLCLASEITVMRACSIGINRIARPIFILALILTLVCFAINETIVPITSSQSKTLGLWALGQKNVPNGKHNFIFKDVTKDNELKRLLFVDKCEDSTLHNVAILDVSDKKSSKIIFAKTGQFVGEGYALQHGAVYNISPNGNLSNTWFGNTLIDFGLNFKDEISRTEVQEYNVIALHKFIEENKKKKESEIDKEFLAYQVQYYDKFALPLLNIVLVLIGIPLAITPPRVRYNRGLLFSILIIFLLFLLRALTMSLGETKVLTPMLAAWLPNLLLLILGGFLYYKKVYKI